jgi:Glycosyl hydrolases family 16.
MLKILLDGKEVAAADVTIEITSAPVASQPLPVFMIDWGPDAPLDGAEVKGLVVFAFPGSLLKNAELVKAGGYDPKYGTVSFGANGGMVAFDTSRMPDGGYTVELVGYDAPKGQPANVVRSGPRTWKIKNSIIADTPPVSGVIVTGTMATPPLILHDAPQGWVQTEYEDWSLYPLGPVERFDPTKWMPRFSHDADTLNGAAEDELYVTPRVKAAGITYNPFSIVDKDGKRALAIMPKKASADELAIMKKLGYSTEKYLSGVLSSLHEQIYGYFEAWHICPNFLGSWAADWLMGPSWFPEFDIMEYLTKPHGTSKIWSAIHYSDKTKSDGEGGAGADSVIGVSTDHWFKLAGLWTPKFVAVYVNGSRIWWSPNPAKTDTIGGLHDLAHRVVNLALGGAPDSWAGPTGDKLAPYYTGPMHTFRMP